MKNLFLTLFLGMFVTAGTLFVAPIEAKAVIEAEQVCKFGYHIKNKTVRAYAIVVGTNPPVKIPIMKRPDRGTSSQDMDAAIAQVNNQRGSGTFPCGGREAYMADVIEVLEWLKRCKSGDIIRLPFCLTGIL